MLNRLLCITALVLVIAGCESDDTVVSDDNAVEFQLDYEKYTLDNGLEIILHVDNSDPVVAVSSVGDHVSPRENLDLLDDAILIEITQERHDHVVSSNLAFAL